MIAQTYNFTLHAFGPTPPPPHTPGIAVAYARTRAGELTGTQTHTNFMQGPPAHLNSFLPFCTVIYNNNLRVHIHCRSW